jgi:hypothetical protein
MHWFVIGYMVTVLWGNGATEEARTQWVDVFFGTAEQCQARATDYLQGLNNKSDSTLSQLKDESVSHAQQPRRYNRGIVQFNYASALCAPFDSEARILKTFPKRGKQWQEDDTTRRESTRCLDGGRVPKLLQFSRPSL